MKIITVFILSLLCACGAAVQTEPEAPEEPAVQIVDDTTEAPAEETAPPVPAIPTE